MADSFAPPVSPCASPTDDAPTAAGGEIRRRCTIRNSRGLHARAAAKFVKLAQEFNCTVDVERDGARVSGCSIMGLMMLAAAQGTTIELIGSGPHAAEAVDALTQLIDAKFNES